MIWVILDQQKLRARPILVSAYHNFLGEFQETAEFERHPVLSGLSLVVAEASLLEHDVRV